MGQPAVQFDESEFDEPAGTVIQLKPPAANPRPSAAPAPAKTELSAILGMVSRTATLLSARKDRAELLEKRSVAIEEQLKAANRKAAELEIRLKTIAEELATERARGTEIQKRSAEVVEKSKTMLNEAGSRMRAAEGRAERAETSYAMIRDALEQQLGSHLK